MSKKCNAYKLGSSFAKGIDMKTNRHQTLSFEKDKGSHQSMFKKRSGKLYKRYDIGYHYFFVLV